MKRPIIFSFIMLFFLLLFSNPGCSQNSYRDNYMKPEKIMDSVGIKPGMIIGEAGAGEGYFTFWLSDRVGNKGRIYANDIDNSALEKITKRCDRENIQNITTIWGLVDDPLFPVDSLEIIIMMTAFHDFTKPVKWMNNVTSYMKPGAKLVIIDRDPDKWGNDDHFKTKEEILSIMKKTDFDLDKIETFLQRDNIYIFNIKEL